MPDEPRMLPLDNARWLELSDAYGAASDIPNLLSQAEQLPEDIGSEAEPYFSLWSALCHQGDVYSASYAALPHLVRIVAAHPDKFRWTLLGLVHAIEVARDKGNGPPIPDDLNDAYQQALTRIPAIASMLMTGNVTELELCVILAACASSQGFPSIGEVITELTPDVTTLFLEKWRYMS